LYGLFRRDHDHRSRHIASSDESALCDNGAGSRLFTQNSSKKCRKCGAQAGEVAGHLRAGLRTPHLEPNLAILALMHTIGHFLHDTEEVECLRFNDRCTTVELGDFTHLGDEGNDAGTRLFRFFDHLALAIAEGRLMVSLQHPQVSAHHRGRRPEFVDRQGKELRIRLCDGRDGVLLRHLLSVAHGTEQGGPEDPQFVKSRSFCPRIRLAEATSLIACSLVVSLLDRAWSVRDPSLDTVVAHRL
jgi:hypothetical protein